MYGVLLIDSIPPATATSMSPVAIPCAASITALRPDPQTLLIVIAATCSCSPPLSAAWRAGFCPSPAATALPMMHSSTIAGSMPARRTASRTAIAPSCGAEKSLSEPRNLPVGVRTAETMTDSRISGSRFEVRASRSGKDAELAELRAEQRLQSFENGVTRAVELARPAVVLGRHVQHAVPQLNRRHAGHCGTDDDGPRERGPFARCRLTPDDVCQHARRDVLNGEHPSDLSPQLVRRAIPLGASAGRTPYAHRLLMRAKEKCGERRERA